MIRSAERKNSSGEPGWVFAPLDESRIMEKKPRPANEWNVA
jgi:hypothetical protein